MTESMHRPKRTTMPTTGLYLKWFPALLVAVPLSVALFVFTNLEARIILWITLAAFAAIGLVHGHYYRRARLREMSKDQIVDG